MAYEGFKLTAAVIPAGACQYQWKYGLQTGDACHMHTHEPVEGYDVVRDCEQAKAVRMLGRARFMEESESG